MSPPSTPLTPPPSLHRQPISFPDLVFSALSLFVLFSSKPAPVVLPKTNFTPRRFLRFPIMSLPPANNRHRFASPQALSDWLRPRLPSESFEAWGVKPGTKNVHNLWLELLEGETTIADCVPPIRTVEVVILRIRDDRGRTLIESHQELSNGVVRNRLRPLSEKMKPGETVDGAAIRAVREELGSIIQSSCGDFGEAGVVTIVPNSYSYKVEERNSMSYPGLPACYVLHSVEAMVGGLPDDEFCTEEEEEYKNSDEKEVGEAVCCKKHYWKWVDPDSL